MQLSPALEVPERDDQLRQLLDKKSITIAFEPILDLLTGRALGFQLLPQGPEPLASLDALWQAACREERLWELNCACQGAMLQAIASLPQAQAGHRFFLPILAGHERSHRHSPPQRAVLSRMAEALGIKRQNLVIEISQQQARRQAEHMEDLIERFVHQGFKVLWSDFGCGRCDLSELVALSPRFLKLTAEQIRHLHRRGDRQTLVRMAVSVAQSIDAKLIAQGVESWEELRALLRLGVRYAQGPLLAAAAAVPTAPPEERLARLRQQAQRFGHHGQDLDESISEWIRHPETLQEGRFSCSELDQLFMRNPALDHVVTLQGRRPTGLITRQNFYAETGGPFGYPLLQNKPAEVTAKSNALIVEEKTSVTALARLAMERLPEDLYDPVIVTDRHGLFIGTATIQQLLARATDLEVRKATGVNPLTNLPGNRAIEQWIHHSLEKNDFTVVYVDLDHFKDYNDVYGFLHGDELIRLTATVLSEQLDAICPGAQLGHVGGDDFIIHCPGDIREEGLLEAAAAFDQRKRKYFTPQDLEAGCYESVDRQGVTRSVRLVTISMAVVFSRTLPPPIHPAQLGQVAAALKKKAKCLSEATGRSSYFIDRRQYASEGSSTPDPRSKK